jgi:hypothetical protein
MNAIHNYTTCKAGAYINQLFRPFLYRISIRFRILILLSTFNVLSGTVCRLDQPLTILAQPLKMLDKSTDKVL